MKNSKKIYFILILVLAIVLIPVNVIAVEETTNETPTEPETPVVPETPIEPETPVVPETPTEPETPQPGTEEEPKQEGTTTNTPSVEQPKEETKKEEPKQEETTTKKPTVVRPTTVVDNATRRVEISILGKDNKLLSGVKFQIQDKKGNIFYEEETTDQVFVFEEMELGTYYLVQITTIDGYEENKERTEFIVSEEFDIVKVEVKNTLKSKQKIQKKKTLLT